MIDRASFFAAVRESLFDGKLSQRQVDGLNTILDAAPADMKPQHLAYGFATTYHETAKTMQPIKEIGGPAYFKRMYDIEGARPEKARELGNLKPGDGAKFCGRGYVQLTGRTNYAYASKRLDVDLVTNPDAAMVPEIAARIMFAGMLEGWFTGKKLADFDGGGEEYDARGARRIINGTDRAQIIAGYYRDFLVAILGASVAAPVPLPPPDIAPPKPVTTPPPSGGFFISLLALLGRLIRRS